ncbi:MAG TPA: hypothetical protein VHQ24_18045, partial [Lachnospiraceae bacterium]|nr:hypothetical protein [Lachnospiraceae bacterium]
MKGNTRNELHRTKIELGGGIIEEATLNEMVTPDKEGTLSEGERKNKRRKFADRKRSIGRKINLLIFSVVAVMLGLLLFLASRAMQFSKEYSGVLDNISKITYIKTNSVKAAKTISNLCIAGGSIKDSGYIETIDSMNTYLSEIDANIGTDSKYNQNRNQLELVRKSLDKYIQNFSDLRKVSGENFSKEGSEFATQMMSNANFVASDVEVLKIDQHEHKNPEVKRTLINASDIV